MQAINFRVAACRPYALLQCPLRTGAKRSLIDGAKGAVRLDSPQKANGLLLVSDAFVAYDISIHAHPRRTGKGTARFAEVMTSRDAFMFALGDGEGCVARFNLVALFGCNALQRFKASCIVPVPKSFLREKPL